MMDQDAKNIVSAYSRDIEPKQHQQLIKDNIAAAEAAGDFGRVKLLRNTFAKLLSLEFPEVTGKPTELDLQMQALTKAQGEQKPTPGEKIKGGSPSSSTLSGMKYQKRAFKRGSWT